MPAQDTTVESGYYQVTVTVDESVTDVTADITSGEYVKAAGGSVEISLTGGSSGNATTITVSATGATAGTATVTGGNATVAISDVTGDVEITITSLT